MKGLTIFFDTDQKWRDMLAVFKLSWEEHMDIPLEIISLPPPTADQKSYGLVTNSEKLYLWRDLFTEDTIFCDCDMLVQADITDGFDYVKNIGYTERTTQSRKFNAGVIFAKYTDHSKRFLAEWCKINEAMYLDNKLRMKYSAIVPGMNQPALAKMLQDGWKAEMVPEAYNICDASRYRLGKMIHLKSEARNVCVSSNRRQLQRTYQRELHDLFWSYLERTPGYKARMNVTVRNASAGQSVTTERYWRRKRRQGLI